MNRIQRIPIWVRYSVRYAVGVFSGEVSATSGVVCVGGAGSLDLLASRHAMGAQPALHRQRSRLSSSLRWLPSAFAFMLLLCVFCILPSATHSRKGRRRQSAKNPHRPAGGKTH